MNGETASPPQGFKAARIGDLRELESGVYWPQLEPHFLAPKFKSLRYRIQDRAGTLDAPGGTVALRGASGVGEFDVAYIADRLAAKLMIANDGLPDYCLTAVRRGALDCTGIPGAKSLPRIDEKLGLIYRGVPGTSLAATGDHERLAIWIPAAALVQRLSAALGGPVGKDLAFEPVFDWSTGPAQSLQRVLRLMAEEMASPLPFAGNAIASRSFSDLLVYTLLHAVPHSHSQRLLQASSPAIPATVKRAEAYIRANVEAPIALHDVADAAGCSVRSLQQGFQRFRDMTPLEAIRRARLEAARQALRSGEARGTVTELALRFGFTNPGRFARMYRAAYGESPVGDLRLPPPRPRRTD
ncbi:helix-turn-helix transcriptional regulator [Roseomonas sp. PWR1]|uniref:Helix-turn-helix transcriptional regulator n=1 Tax=Roseomonas nitratireducens TaxID=2820810 RepID=A0ABS4AR29_9PROT|nr:AraC family transcriptional regulator [Neoroseomonas nitratireducens]MBP0463824.1 helix-turn-helix transcriptional regulator [Neoroseomonas nitratireducens]